MPMLMVEGSKLLRAFHLKDRLKLYGKSLPYKLQIQLLLGDAIHKSMAVERMEPYTANEVPQPQVVEALGLVNVNPLLFNPPW